MSNKWDENVRRIRALDEDAWRTINGAHVLIDGDSGEVKGGAGGKLNGRKLNVKGGTASPLKSLAKAAKTASGSGTNTTAAPFANTASQLADFQKAYKDAQFGSQRATMGLVSSYLESHPNARHG